VSATSCRSIAVLTLAALCCAQAGCAFGAKRYGESGGAYPQTLDRLPAVDVQVLADPSGQTLSLTNATAEPLGPGTLWLNAWYSREIDRIGIGETVRLPLGGFRDVYGEAVRTGGFFATERPETIVLAELEVAEGLRRLVVVDLERIE